MELFDKRLELLEALVVAAKNSSNNSSNEELDFVEYYNIPYVKDLVKKINIEKYPEIIEYINDIEDCSFYTNLYLYFDNDFNLEEIPKKAPFTNKTAHEFALIVKKIFDNEKIEEIFNQYSEYLNKLEIDFKSKYNTKYKKELSKLFGPIDNINFLTKISLLINGGFSASRDNNVVYVKGIKTLDNIEKIEFNEYTIVCLFHEYSHFFVNDIIDNYYNKIKNVDILYNESLNNGLPKTYHNKKALLYEYFVRACSMILSEKKISEQEYIEDTKWDKEIGFIRIEEIINYIKKGLSNNNTFEKIFQDMIIDYFESIEANHREEEYLTARK